MKLCVPVCDDAVGVVRKSISLQVSCADLQTRASSSVLCSARRTPAVSVVAALIGAGVGVDANVSLQQPQMQALHERWVRSKLR